MTLYARQSVSEVEIDAVIEVLRSDWLTQDPTMARFEDAVAGYCQARFCGASVDFIDVEPGTWNTDVEALSSKLSQARKTGAPPSAVIAVHFAGHSYDTWAIGKFSEEYGFKVVIEDAAHAIGGNYPGHKIGACIYSDLATFSFHSVKIITTGEGGMVVTNNAALN